MGNKKNYRSFEQLRAADVFEEPKQDEPEIVEEVAEEDTVDQVGDDTDTEGADNFDSPEDETEDHGETDIEEGTDEAEEEPVVEDAPPVPQFPFTEVSEWTKEELEVYISRPDNMDIYHSKLVQAVESHRRISTDLNRAWSVDECTDFLKNNIVPETTRFGCYVKDVTRKTRRESEWTTQELESWALDLIRPEGLVTTNGLAVELHARFKMPIQSVAPEMVIAHYKYNFGPDKGSVTKVGQVPVVTAAVVEPEVVKEVERKIKYAGLTDMNQSYIEDSLKQYVETVRPNKVITQKAGFEAQRLLDNVLHAILKLEDPVGVKSGLDILFTIIVAERIHNVKGVFSDTNAFRFAEGIALEAKKQETHRRLFTLFFAFIDGDEGILAQTDVPELIKYLPPRQQNLLLGYLRRS